ncbi:hypothetical protein [Microbacterium sp. USHLN186]|uniref:hypothetical protein n=1 Tax=Microbacterium sp. USHLN186 TaxID=3081286 RepID=UPI003018FB6D
MTGPSAPAPVALSRRNPGLWPLWAAFIAAHAGIAVAGWVLPSQPMGDVVHVYQPWARTALGGGSVVGVTDTWVYPQLALLPMMLTQLLSTPFAALVGPAPAYLMAWALLVTAGDALALVVLLGRGGGRRRLAAWFWIAALLLLGPIALYRIDAVTVPLAVAGGIWLVRHPRFAAAALTVGAWIKIWPGAVLVAAVAAGRRPGRLVLVAASITGGIVVVLLLLAGDAAALLGFLTEQSGRGLQIEAVAATPLLWMVRAGAARIEYSFDILTYQIVAPAAATVAELTTPVMILAVAGIVLLGIRQWRRGARWQQLLPPLALALVTALIVTNKVGSPQFETWLIPPAIMWIVYDSRRAETAAALVLLLCALTFAVYPLTYDGLLAAAPLPVLLLSVRNVMLVVLLVLGVRALLRTPVGRR